MVPLPTFPILRAGESHYREKTKFPKLAETSSFLRIRSYPVSFLSGTPVYKRNGSSVGVRSSVNLVRERDPIAGATAARGIRAAPPIQRDGDRCKRNGDSQSQGFRKCGFKPKSGGNAQILDLRRPLRASLDPDHQSVIMSELL